MGVWVCAVLLLVLVKERALQPACKLQAWKQSMYSKEGDLTLGAMFLVHSEYSALELTFKEDPRAISCEGFHIRYYRDVLAMVFAIEEINQSRDLLPNLTLGFQIMDSCMSQIKAIGGVLELLSGIWKPIPGYRCHSGSMPAGIIGELMSSISAPMARILGVFHVPQISYGSVLSSLSDKLQFPSFLRTVPSSAFQNMALARLMEHFHWTWIGMIISDDDLGLQGGQDMKRLIEKHGGCVAFTEKVHLSYSRENIFRVVQVAQSHAVKVIIVHSPEVHVKKLMDVFSEQNVTELVLVFSASFTLTFGLFDRVTWKLFNGSLGLSPHAKKMPDFEEFLAHLNPSRYPNDTFIKLFWEKVFNCKWSKSEDTDTMTPMENMGRFCSENQTLDKNDFHLFELYDLSYTYHTYLAVYVLAHSLDNLMSCKAGQGPFMQGTCADVNNLQPWQVLHYVKNINVSIGNGDKVSFDVNGDAPLAYDILNVQILNSDDVHLENVGRYDPQDGKGVTVNTNSILWAKFSQVPRSVCSEDCPPGYRKAGREGKPICCFECISCSHGEIKDPDTDECIQCPQHQWPNENHVHCIQKVIEFLLPDEPLGQILIISAALMTFLTACVLCVFIKYRDTPLVKGNNRGLSYLLLLSLMLCFLCSFIFIGQPRKLTCMLRQTVFGVAFTVSVSCVLAKTVIVVIAFKATNPSSASRKWLGSKTPSCIVLFCSTIQVFISTIWLVRSPPFPELTFLLSKEKIIFACNEGDAIFFYCMMGYIGLLAAVSFIMAFLSRNLPGSFNESKLITFSMLVFVSVWISFIPAYLSTWGKYMVAVEVFAILCSGAGLLGCIFLPKCYIILVRPDRNTRKHLVRKD